MISSNTLRVSYFTFKSSMSMKFILLYVVNATGWDTVCRNAHSLIVSHVHSVLALGSRTQADRERRWSLWPEHRDMVNRNLALKGFLLKKTHLCSRFISQSESHGQKERRTGLCVNRLDDYYEDYGSNFLFPDNNFVVSAQFDD